MMKGRHSPSAKYSHQLRIVYSRPHVHWFSQDRLCCNNKEISKFSVSGNKTFISLSDKKSGGEFQVSGSHSVGQDDRVLSSFQGGYWVHVRKPDSEEACKSTPAPELQHLATLALPDCKGDREIEFSCARRKTRRRDFCEQLAAFATFTIQISASAK